MGNTNKHINQKRGLFIFIVILLFIPMLQQNLNLFPKNTLRGSFELAKKPELSTQNWIEGEFQSKSQSYLNDHLGFRPFFVRIYNQIHYSFYNIAKANGVIVGKSNFLYEENYIKAHLGIDFIGEKAIKEKVYKLKKIQDTLSTKGIDLIVMLAPGKASFYPEYIPDSFYKLQNDSTNYEYYKKEISSNQINLLDFNKWFIDIKGKKQANLYPKTGIHWSMYGQSIVIDSLIRYISKLKQTDLPKLIMDTLVFSTNMQGTDQDIENGMNLLNEISDLKMGYTKISIKNTIQKKSPLNMLTIGDSYYLGLQRRGVFNKVFSNNEFWFYNQQIYKSTESSKFLVSDIDILKEVEKNDVILLMATDANLYKFGFGFIDDVYDIYYTKLEDRVSYKKEQRILNYMESIRENTMQNKSIQEKAEKNGIPFEEELRNNAKYMIWVEDGKP